MPYTLPLSELHRSSLPVAGGKGANLGELVRAGFPVPDGFVVTTAAYDLFVERAGLDPVITQALSGPEGGTAARSAFERDPIPDEAARAIREAYEKMGNGSVAARSSATAEDLPEAAFAGQQESFLNVVGPEALLDAVRRCWASLWTDRAIYYRARLGISQRTVKMAVVVQRMVAAEVAGVMFTANPVTGARDEAVIDASPGLGEAVVAGLVTPDHFVLRKRLWGWSAIEWRPGRREIVVRTRPEGGIEQVRTSVSTGAPVLPDGVLHRLAQTGARIARLFGQPQDIEWAYASGRINILQARPITALPEPVPRPWWLVQMLAAFFAELLPVRPYPLDMTTWLVALSDAAVKPVFQVLGIAVPPPEKILIVEDGVVVGFSGRLPIVPTPAMFIALPRLCWLACRYHPARFRSDPRVARAKAEARALEKRPLKGLPWEGLISTIRQALGLVRPLGGEPRSRYLPRAVFAAAYLGFILFMLGRGKSFGRLLFGGESATLEANRALDELASRVRSDPALAGLFRQEQPTELLPALEKHPSGPAFLKELAAFLDRYGHREAVISTFLEPTWKDAPATVLGIIKGLVSSEPRKERPAWEVAEDDLMTHPVLRIRPLGRAMLRLVATARLLWQVREDTHFNVTAVMPILRRTALEMGQRLQAAGVLDTPEDVFHLKFGELEQLGTPWPPSLEQVNRLRSTALRRKERRAALEGKPVIDPRLYLQGRRGAALLQGTPGSPGVAEGPVRIIRSVAEFDRLRPGEILVAPHTNPAWTLLFPRAAAIVVDSGGPASHAAVVAREYGIPAVMGTMEGTKRLAEGQMVRVDGNAGTVSVLP